MKMDKELYNICLEKLTSRGKRVEIDNYKDLAGNLTAQIIAAGYIRYDMIDLDPQKCIQLLASILNAFKENRPYVVVEKEEKNENTQEDSPADGEVSPEVV